jgi:hypothetical protein
VCVYSLTKYSTQEKWSGEWARHNISYAIKAWVSWIGVSNPQNYYICFIPFYVFLLSDIHSTYDIVLWYWKLRSRFSDAFTWLSPPEYRKKNLFLEYRVCLHVFMYVLLHIDSLLGNDSANTFPHKSTRTTIGRILQGNGLVKKPSQQEKLCSLRGTCKVYSRIEQ